MKRLIYLVAGGLVLFASPVSADVREDVFAAMHRCSTIQDDRTWLNCIYGAQQLMRAKLGLTPAPDFQQRLVPPAPFAATRPIASETVPQVSHKEGVLQIFNTATPALVVSVLVGVRYDEQGGFIATLENGQVWHQVNLVEGSPKARLTLGAKVTIQRGAVWSYDLKIGKNPHTFKVDREA